MTCLVMTLEDMLRLALGTNRPDQVNMEILHSFLKIFIKKLEIETDFVEISGPEVRSLRHMLCHATTPLMEFKSIDNKDDECDTREQIANLEENINRLTNVVNQVESELKVHLEAMDRCKQPPATGRLKLRKPKTNYDPGEESQSSDCEDTCTGCDEQNLIACDLLQNGMFLKKLMRKVTSPVVDRIFEFENMIRILNEKFQNFLNIAEDEYRKIPLIEDCLAQLKELKIELDQHKIDFIATMQEVQDMLDNKLDKIQIPPLKKYLSDRMDAIEKELYGLIHREECPKAAAVIMTSMQCLCCTTRVCQKDRVYPVPLLTNAVSASKPGNDMQGEQPRLCIPRDRERACGGEHTVIRLAEKSLTKTNLIDEFGDKTKLRVGRDKVNYIKGLDGGMYRLAPDIEVPCKGNL